MTVATTTNKVVYNGDGVATLWSFSFPILQSSDMQVYVTDPTGIPTLLTSNYSVDIANSRVTYPSSGTPLAVGYKITLLRSVGLDQTTDWKNQGPFNSEVLEAAADKLTMQAQQLTEALARSLKLPQAETGSDTNTRLPAVANRASMFLAFDASGNPIAASAISSVPVSSFMATVLDDVSGIAARTTLGMYPDEALGASGTPGSLSIFPPTALKGSLRLKAANSTGDTITDIVNAAQAAARVYTIPDAGADASFVMTQGVQNPINGTKLFADLRGTLGANLAAGGFILTGLGAGAAAGNSVRYEQLKVLQVVMGTSTTGFSTSSTSFTNTNLSASITPSSTSNKILVIAVGTIENNSTAKETFATIARGGSNILGTNGQIQFYGTNDSYGGATLVYLDSPASVSSLTYSVQIKVTSPSSGSFGLANQTQVMILVEVAP